LPFCSSKWGETTYMVGIIPLGGYVAMVGEKRARKATQRVRKTRAAPQRRRLAADGDHLSGVIMNVDFGMECLHAA